VLPFMAVMLVLVALLVAFPQLATWLPKTMRG
jgi:TRAP-type C4-dicarboxylate transport system permease large subunit